jgi:hypothetical protein
MNFSAYWSCRVASASAAGAGDGSRSWWRSFRSWRERSFCELQAVVPHRHGQCWPGTRDVLEGEGIEAELNAQPLGCLPGLVERQIEIHTSGSRTESCSPSAPGWLEIPCPLIGGRNLRLTNIVPLYSVPPPRRRRADLYLTGPPNKNPSSSRRRVAWAKEICRVEPVVAPGIIYAVVEIVGSRVDERIRPRHWWWNHRLRH